MHGPRSRASPHMQGVVRTLKRVTESERETEGVVHVQECAVRSLEKPGHEVALKDRVGEILSEPRENNT